MAARRNNIEQRTRQPQQQLPVNNQKQNMNPLMVLSMHEERIKNIETRIESIQSTDVQNNKSDSLSVGDSQMLKECIKQIKFLTQENQVNRNLTRELTLELLRLKTSLQEENKIKYVISEREKTEFEDFKEEVNNKNSQPVMVNNNDEHIQEHINLDDNTNFTDAPDTVALNGHIYDPNKL